MTIREAATIGDKTLFTYYSECFESPRVDYDNFGHMICWHRRYNLGDKHDHNDPEDFLAAMVIEHCDVKRVYRFVKEGKAKEVRLTYDRKERVWNLGSLFNNKWFAEAEYPSGLTAKTVHSTFHEDVAEFLTIGEKMHLLRENDTIIILPLFLYDHSGITMSTGSFSCRFDSGQVGWIYASKAEIVKEYGDASKESFDRAKALLQSEVETYDLYLTGECYGYETYEGESEVDNCGGYLGEYKGFIEDIRGELGDDWSEVIDALSNCSSNSVADYFWARRRVA